MDKIYYISHSGSLHNINDVCHKLIENNKAYVGVDHGEDGFEVTEEITLLSIEEALELFS
jgi:hypothetical protein